MKKYTKKIKRTKRRTKRKRTKKGKSRRYQKGGQTMTRARYKEIKKDMYNDSLKWYGFIEEHMEPIDTANAKLMTSVIKKFKILNGAMGKHQKERGEKCANNIIDMFKNLDGTIETLNNLKKDLPKSIINNHKKCSSLDQKNLEIESVLKIFKELQAEASKQKEKNDPNNISFREITSIIEKLRTKLYKL